MLIIRKNKLREGYKNDIELNIDKVPWTEQINEFENSRYYFIFEPFQKGIKRGEVGKTQTEQAVTNNEYKLWNIWNSQCVNTADGGFFEPQAKNTNSERWADILIKNFQLASDSSNKNDKIYRTAFNYTAGKTEI